MDRHAIVTLIDALLQNTYASIKVGGGKARKPKAVKRPKPGRHTRVTVSVDDLLRAEANRPEEKG